jgi:hypothetical protein
MTRNYFAKPPTYPSVDAPEDTFMALYESFAASELGQALGETVRYERYKPAFVDNEEWQELLGADVNNLAHLKLTYGLTRAFLVGCREANSMECRFSRREEAILLTVAVVHDWAEALKHIGDVSFDLKTAAQEKAEHQELARLLQAHESGSIDVASVMDVIKHPESLLGRAFNAIERVGYLRTALRAWEQVPAVMQDRVRPLEQREELGEGLVLLTQNVLFNQIPTLLGYERQYPPVRSYLDQKAPRITEALTGIHAVKLDWYDADLRYPNSKKHIEALRLWMARMDERASTR